MWKAILFVFGVAFQILLCVIIPIGMMMAVESMWGLEVVLSILTSAVIFVVVWLVVGNLYFKPYVEVLIRREERTAGDEKRATEMKQEALALDSEVEAALQQTRLQCIVKRDEVVGEARQKAQEILQQAADSAETKRQAARKQIDELKTAAQADVETEAEKLAKLVVERVGTCEESTMTQ